jgi:serine protease Do
VTIERPGARPAVGTVLGGDGRILTALSALGGADSAEVRYGDGTSVRAKLVAGDRVLDLGLLAPGSPRAVNGLSASEADARDTDLVVVVPLKGGALRPIPAVVRGPVDAHARTGEPLSKLLELAMPVAPVAGAPLLDSSGTVAGVMVSACKGPPALSRQACEPVLLAAPVSAVRAFLAHGQPAAPAASPWLGVRAEPQGGAYPRGARIVAVAPSSPAEKCGLVTGDVVVAVEGKPVDGPKMLADAIGRHGIGDKVDLLVFGGAGIFRQVLVELRPAP